MYRTASPVVARHASWAIVLVGFAVCCSGSAASAADRLMRVHPREVKVGGEIGRRIDVTVQNNLLKLKLEEDFLKPFRERKAKDGFTGLGMLSGRRRSTGGVHRRSARPGPQAAPGAGNPSRRRRRTVISA